MMNVGIPCIGAGMRYPEAMMNAVNPIFSYRCNGVNK